MDISPHESLFGSLSGTMDLSPNSFEDDVDDFGNLSDGDSPEQLDSSIGPKRKSRRLPSTAEKRANHNAVERARRESLNGRFMELARILPSMTVNKRPSKNAIVSNSLEFVKTARAREQALESENARLRKEVHELRAKLGMQSVDMSNVSTVTAPAPITKSSLKSKPAQDKTSHKQAKAQPAPLVMPAIARTNSAPVISTATSYMTPDALLGFIDPFASTLKAASPPSDSTSDTESSIVTTPASSYGFDGASLSPLFFEETPVSAINPSMFEHDLLAACGMQSSFPAPAGIPNWAATAGMGMSYNGAPTFALYA